ncbi:f-box domain-containing protein [Gigaspora margarita]|uniref:F-box domain-containing protein n=1 Tax=Gigaspora margarita TaxID=4874 RepID=A0A8H4AT53_GIGMA|nr:f-box domain-containing protein [Gigaspora margarita]
MIPLPNECLFEIFTYLRTYYRCLFSCLLVNRQWCMNVVPILWSSPLSYFEDKRLIRIYLLSLNDEEQIPLIPLKIMPLNNQKPLFQYTSYTRYICCYGLIQGIVNFLNCDEYNKPCSLYEKVQVIKCSLITMFLRTSRKLEYLSIQGLINNKIMNSLTSYFYENSSVTHLNFYKNQFNFEEINALAEVLYKDTTLNSLSFNNINLGMEGIKIVTGALCENKTLISFSYRYSQLNFDE